MALVLPVMQEPQVTQEQTVQEQHLATPGQVALLAIQAIPEQVVAPATQAAQPQQTGQARRAHPEQQAALEGRPATRTKL